MKKVFLAMVSMVFVFAACNNSAEETVSVENENEVTIADSVVSVVDTVVLDTLSNVAIDSAAREDYENDLSLEIKEIEEEIENPISEECKLFLEDYAEGVKSFSHLAEKIAANPEDIGLQIQLSSAEEDLNGWASKPQMFQCSQNSAFQKQIEILNEKRDRLLSL